jgi:glycine/D-amino acid oxidase-like deaminating enzyme
MPIRPFPRDEQTCGWIAGLPPPKPARRLRQTENADAVVIGAGFTGLAAARRLATHHPEWRVVIVEAQHVGAGASGRNSGFVVDLPHFNPSQDIELNRRLRRLSRAGWNALRQQVDTGAVECGWAERGRLHVAVGDVGRRGLERFATALEAMDEPFVWLDCDAVSAITGTTHYRSAVRTMGGATMQPAAVVRAVAATLPDNIDLFEESPVHTIRHHGSFELGANGGTLRTPRLLLATNGYTPRLGFLRRRLFPLLTFGSLTRVLSAAEQNALGGEREWGVVSEAQLGGTVRRTADQRILIRNTVRYTHRLEVGTSARQQIAVIHRQALAIRFPMLRQVPFEYTWCGVMGASFNGIPYFGQLDDGIFAAAGYNGVGVALGTICGALLADLVVGADSPLLDDVRALPQPNWIPPEPLLGVGVRATLTRMAATAREEQ